MSDSPSKSHFSHLEIFLDFVNEKLDIIAFLWLNFSECKFFVFKKSLFPNFWRKIIGYQIPGLKHCLSKKGLNFQKFLKHTHFPIPSSVGDGCPTSFLEAIFPIWKYFWVLWKKNRAGIQYFPMFLDF